MVLAEELREAGGRLIGNEATRGRVATDRAYRHLGVTAEGALPLA